MGMARVLLRVTLVAVLSYAAFSGIAPAQNRQSQDQDVIHFVEEYDGAWNRKDAASVERFLAADYVYFTSKGAIHSRQQMLDMVLSPKYVLVSADRSEMKVYRTSSTAVVSSRWKGHGTYDGRGFQDDQRCSIVLGREKQGWQVLSEHCTQIAVP
jgi:ketosteroid isomerase-like protein